MARLAMAVALGVLAAGTAAQAQVTNVIGASVTDVSTTPTAGPTTFTNTGAGLFDPSPGSGQGAAFYSSFANGASTISFESANASSGNTITTTSTSAVRFTITNGGTTGSVTPTLASTISPGGVGLYMADLTGSCAGSGVLAGGDPYGGCGQVTTGSFQDLNQRGVPINVNLAGATFDFRVTVGRSTVYDLTGTEALFLSDGNGFHITPLNEVLTIDGVATDLTGALTGENEIFPGAAGTADAFLWDATNLNIGLGGPLAAGASEQVTYSATVSTFSDVGCASTDLSECVVPFAALGDPIGKGGSISGNAKRFGGPLLDMAPADAPTAVCTSDTIGSSIPFVDCWKPQSFRVPTFNLNTGLVSFSAGVPEPATWTSMIFGFGLLGAALRRRRVLGYT